MQPRINSWSHKLRHRSLGIVFTGSGRFAIWSGECLRCGTYLCKMGPNNCPAMTA